MQYNIKINVCNELYDSKILKKMITKRIKKMIKPYKKMKKESSIIGSKYYTNEYTLE